MKVIVVDDHWAVRDGLKWVFAEHDDIDLIGDVANGNELRSMLDAGLIPDVVVLDIQLENASGVDLLAWLKEHHPEVRVVMLSMFDDPMFVRRSIELGADGYVLKSAGAEELARALAVVAGGGVHVQGEAARVLVGVGDDEVTLSPREREILSLVADGKENKQIARRLGIAETTVKTHLRSAFERLGVTSRSEAVATAMRLGLID